MRILGCLSVILGLTSGAALAEPHRQHAPHEHGHGTLNLAIDGKKMVLQLTAPSQDIVGFEHAATTPSQQEAVHHARTALSSPADLFTGLSLLTSPPICPIGPIAVMVSSSAFGKRLK